MSKKQLLAAILKLPVDERFDLISEVEEHTLPPSLPTHTEWIASDESPEFIAELDRRLAEYIKNPSRARTWEQVSRSAQTRIRKIRQERSTLHSRPKRKLTSSKRPNTTK